ncbi:MAG: hypothetical protein Q7S84_03000 [bacterium]|nr:hypothetical protein [bacterium]
MDSVQLTAGGAACLLARQSLGVGGRLRLRTGRPAFVQDYGRRGGGVCGR